MSEKDPKWRGPSEPDVATLVQSRLVEKLADSERRHREILRELPDIVLRLDEEGKLLYANEAWETQLGHPVGDIQGTDVESFILADDRAKWRNLVIPEGEVPAGDQDRVVRFRATDDSVHWMSARLRKLESGEIVGSLDDVTVRRQLEADIVRAQRLDSIGRLAGGLAHDFNNLLMVILGNVDLAQVRLKRKAIDLKELELARRACDHASQLTRQMLTFSKGGEPVRKPGSAAKLVREAVELALRGSKVRPILHIDDTAPPVEMDASQMHQVINNLILNAEEAMPEGGILHVTVEEHPLQTDPKEEGIPGVAIEIADEGPGIEKEDLEHVLEPYFTTKETGNGLGLTSSYSIVKRHDGTFEIESTPGEGTRIRITLPITNRDLNEELATPEEASGGMTGRILVMDDDEGVRNSLSAMLESLGHGVVTTSDGEQCLAAFRAARERPSKEEAFDVVILDLTIAGGHDGLWTIERLREVDPGVKAVVVSGYSNDPVLAGHEKFGFRDVLTKPFLLADLERVINDLLTSETE